MEKTEIMISIHNLSFSWQETAVIKIDSFHVKRMEHLFIEGPSGSGKSTLLSLLAGILTPDKGNISVLDKELSTLNDSQKDNFRAEHIGFIFQQFNLIPYLNVLENVTLPCRFSKKRKSKAIERSGTLEKDALRLLKSLGLDNAALLSRSINELSIGQQQRVAAARAMIGSPEIIIADEPTSALDFKHREVFVKTLFEECKKEDITLIFVSHDSSLKKLFNRTIDLLQINDVTYEEAL